MILITPENHKDYFYIEKLKSTHNIKDFNGSNSDEYTLFFKIEYDKNLPIFYEKNGFAALQNKKYTKKTRTLPMWTDVYFSKS